MTETNLYSDIAARTDGAFMLGVVGPVRTGKSTFIKRFMETLVIPRIENEFVRERAKDELPQSGSGKTIMTAEPKFVPENPVTIRLDNQTELSVRLVDCVGYMVDGAAGHLEDGQERMVTTPWFDHEITLSEAAEKGTYKVITEHSTVGIVVTTDGSICEIPRESYAAAEARTITELKQIGKPFIVLLNSTDPKNESCRALAAELSERYAVRCIPVNCLRMDENDIAGILSCVMEEFPIDALELYLPDWLDALPGDDPLRASLYSAISEAAENLERVRDCDAFMAALREKEEIEEASLVGRNLGSGVSSVAVMLPRSLYYRCISEETGLDIKNDRDLIRMLTEMSAVKADYDSVSEALAAVRSSGYGVVMPSTVQMQLEEPQIVRQGGKYSVRLKANAPAIHMFMTNVETEVTPAIGGESASEEIINFLLQGFDGDVNRIWQSNIFGKSLNVIAEEGLTAKLDALPENAKDRLRKTLERVVNEGCGGLICILL